MLLSFNKISSLTCFVMQTILSDHMPVYAIKKREHECKEFKYCYGRSYKWYDTNNFTEDIRNHWKWEEFWQCDGNPDHELLWEIMVSSRRMVYSHYT